MQTISTERQREAALLGRAGEGDQVVLARIYEDHVDALWSFVFYRVGRDPSLCEDVVAETFLVAFEQTAAFDPSRGSLRTWLCQLSRNVIRRHRRALARGHELAATWERIDATLMQVFQNLEAAPLGDEVLAREETRDLVQMTIANLPDDYRDALERKYLRGQSMRELAERFELSEAATKSMLARARRAFREAFTTLAEAFAGPLGGPINGPMEESDHVRA
ncbi:MAG: RNA polymerase sigma factor [Myxococcales bacterium]|nr:RNA polymerase sigma factor [Myxococcales bacterium]